MLWASLVTSRSREMKNDRRALSWRKGEDVHKKQNDQEGRARLKRGMSREGQNYMRWFRNTWPGHVVRLRQAA